MLGREGRNGHIGKRKLGQNPRGGVHTNKRKSQVQFEGGEGQGSLGTGPMGDIKGALCPGQKELRERRRFSSTWNVSWKKRDKKGGREKTWMRGPGNAWKRGIDDPNLEET